MKKILIVGNWKMHMSAAQASLFVHRLHEHLNIYRNVETVIAPSALHLQPLSLQIDRRRLRLCVQNAYHVDEGAYTGEISFSMVHGLVHYALIGHSERRYVFGEDLKMVKDKVMAAVRNGITPILCVGETQTEKLAGETLGVVHDQLTTAIANLTADEVARMVVAYEPVWAISSGKNFADHPVATPSDAAKVAKHIRSTIEQLYGVAPARAVRILYGGSTNADNAKGFLEAEGVDGLLPGGASLNYWQFSQMVKIAHQVQHKKQGGF
jgi:triosephosphate isomerase (TIM)